MCVQVLLEPLAAPLEGVTDEADHVDGSITVSMSGIASTAAVLKPVKSSIAIERSSDKASLWLRLVRM
jgi:hypothetical protein